jgi:glycosyltransferase involved in cell wall biosynthesis
VSDTPSISADSPKLRLAGVRVLVLTVGHDVADQRVYGKMAHGVAELGADVTIVGLASQRRPSDVRVMELGGTDSTAIRATIQPWRCLWKARHIPADIVHFHDPELLLVLPAARVVWPRAKFIYDVHEDISQLIRVRDWLPSAFRGMMSLAVGVVEKSLSRLAHGVIGVTGPLTEKFPHSRRATAYNFVTSDYFKLAEKSVRPFAEREYEIAHLGALRRRRAEFLAAALAEFHRRRPGTRSIVFGCSTDIIDELRAMLPAECEVRGRLPHDEIPQILGNSKIGLDVHPWREPHLEVALPVKVCEYMACECGVVSSAMPVLSELCREGSPPGLQIISGGQPVDYAEQAIRLLGDIESHPSFAVQNREFALRRMNWDVEIGKVADLYLSLLGRTEEGAKSAG